MLRLFYRNNGSITVFLSIILVPMLLFASIMVDSSAYMLSKASVESAGELATNSALANYDTVLRDVYGLFAMSQAADDPNQALKENVRKYFENSLTANGIIDEADDIWDSDTLNWVTDVINGAFGLDYDSLPGVVNAGLDDNAVIQYVPDSSLANPEVLWTQIVEYSEYRVPVNAAISALDSLGAFKKVAAQSDVLQSKTDMDEKLENVNKGLKKLYDSIKGFDEKVGEVEAVMDEVKDAEFGFEEAKAALLACHSILMEIEIAPLKSPIAKCTTGQYSSIYDNLVFLAEDSNNEYYYCKVAGGAETVMNYGMWKKNKSLEDISEEYDKEKAKADEAYNAMGAYHDKVKGYAAYSNMDLENAYNGCETTNPVKLKEALDKYKAFSEHVILLEQIRLSVDEATPPAYTYSDAALNPSDETIKKFYEEPKAPKNATAAEKKEAQEEAWKKAKEKAIADAKQDEEDAQDKVFDSDKAVLDKKIANTIISYQKKSNNYKEALKAYQNHFQTYDKRLKEYLRKINALMKPIADPAADLAFDKSFQWDWLQTNYGTKAHLVKEAAEEVRKQIAELDIAAENCQKAVGNYEEDFVQAEAGTISDNFSATLMKDAENIRSKYKEEDLDEIKQQVEAVEKYVSCPSDPMGVLATFNAYQLCGVGIPNYLSKMRDDADSVIQGLVDHLVNEYSDNSAVKGALQKAVEGGTFYNLDRETEALAIPKGLDTSVLHNMGSDTSNPYNACNTNHSCYLKRISEAGVKTADGGESINIPAFYFYLITLFEVKQPDKNGTKKEDITNYQKKQEEEAKSDNNKGLENLSYSMDLLDGVPSGDQEGEKGNAQDGSGIFAFLKRVIASFQDIVHAVTHLKGENVVETLLVCEYIMNEFSLYSDKQTAETEGEEKYEKHAKKTFSNVRINAANNAMYGCEVEYILYGNKGSKKKKFLFLEWGKDKGPEVNVNCAREDIFAARMMFNTVFAMTDSTINNETLPPAMAIQAATGGIFPYQLAQTIIKLCLALAESNNDVEHIVDKNEKMPLVKTKETWVFQLSGVADLFRDELNEKTNELVQEGMNKVREKTNEGLQKAIDYVTEGAEDLVDKVGDNIKTSVRGCVDEAVSSVTQCYSSTIEAYYQKILTQGKEYSREELLQQCEEAASQYLDSTNADDQVKGLIRDSLISQLEETLLPVGGKIDTGMKEVQNLICVNAGNAKEYASSLADNFVSFTDELATASEKAISMVNKKVIEVTDSISNNIKKETDKVVNDMFDKADEKAEGYSKQLSNTINEKLNEFFPSSATKTNVEMGEGKTSSALGSSFSLGYEDYIRIFLLVKLLGDDTNTVMTRVADVIQVNINQGLGDYEKEHYVHPKKGSFKMQQANTYMEIDGRIKIKPLLISQDWFAGKLGEKIEYLQYDYHTIAGY